MNKITKIMMWLVIIMFASFVVAGTLVAIGGLHNLDFENGKYKDNINETKNISAEGITIINVEGVSEDIEIIPYDSKEITVNLRGYFTMTENREPPKLKTIKDGETLKIFVETSDDWVFDFGMNDFNIDVYVPRYFIGTYEIETVSGDFEINELEINKLKLESISGDVEGNNLIINEVVFDTVSGDFSLKGDIGSSKMSSISGDISIISGILEGNYDLESVSGDVYIDLDDDSSYNVDFSSSSGDVSTKVPLIIEDSSDNRLKAKKGESDVTIRVDTVSGDFTLN